MSSSAILPVDELGHDGRGEAGGKPGKPKEEEEEEEEEDDDGEEEDDERPRDGRVRARKSTDCVTTAK
jgi:hypothetical protein